MYKPLKLICYFQEVEPNSSAVAIRAKYFIKSLAKQIGFGVTSIHILTATKSRETKREPGIFCMSIPIGSSDETRSIIKRTFAEFLFGLRSVIWLSRNRKSSALLISSPNYIPAVFLSLAARFLRVPYLLDIRDIYPEAYAQSGLMKESSLFYRVLTRVSESMYANALAVTTATEGLARDIRRHNNKTECVYNGFPSALVDMNTPKHSRFTVCFHGVMGFFQDIETLASIIQHPKLAAVDFVVIGYGRKSAILESIVSQNFYFLGRLSHDETMQEVSRCHIGISIRAANGISRDSFPVKLWEYFGLAIPSLIYPKSEAGIFLEENNCGVQLKTKDVDQIAQVILGLQSDQASYCRLKESCEKARLRFSRELLADRFAAVVLDSLQLKLQ